MNYINEYMNELVNYGGVMTPRYKVIKDLKELGATQKIIDDYLFELDKQKDIVNKLLGRRKKCTTKKKLR